MNQKKFALLLFNLFVIGSVFLSANIGYTELPANNTMNIVSGNDMHCDLGSETNHTCCEFFNIDTTFLIQFSSYSDAFFYEPTKETQYLPRLLKPPIFS